MNQHNNGGPAFPNTGMHHSDKGMSLRDYFAAKAMHGFLVGDAILKESDSSEQWIEKTAVAAYQMADAMLRAREGV